MPDDLYGTFADPGPEWRGKPFWSWNGLLEKDELLRQIEVMREMGLGGYFMHSRTGLVTEYLGDEWFDLTNACADEGERLGMESWLYDEDRWPSGTAGGLVTANLEHRARFLSMEDVPAAEFAWEDDLVAAFEARVEGVDCLGAHRLAPGEAPREGLTVLTFRVVPIPESSFYNGNTDVDRLSLAATEEFLRLTHEQYRLRCGDRLGRSIRGIFTDEPHRQHLMTGFGSSHPNVARMVPWTPKLPEEYASRFGEDLLERLPELFLRPEGYPVSPVKWRFVELLQQLFLENFARPIYEWCESTGMLLTGHVLHEDSLTCQVAMHGSLARFYEWMHLPGVDVLTEGNRAYWIAKQLDSAARQLGQRWRLSELYGCTGWQMSFESHKAVGDWQALFGVNLRCQHLSWYTMAGEAKRDFPASILHQSAWWKQYATVEDYFARLGVLLTEGKPACDVLVLSPVESLWAQIRVGWASFLSPLDPRIQEIERDYAELFHTLAGGQIDFDYADEEMLGRLGKVECDAEGAPLLRVGQASYRAAVLGTMDTLRGSSLALLEEFRAAGGAVVFVGEPPRHVDAQPSESTAELASRSTRVTWERPAIRAAVRPYLARPVEALDPATGAHLEGIFCQLREEGARTVLVALNVSPDAAVPEALLRVRASGPVAEWRCLTGERLAADAREVDGWVEIATSFVASGERCFVLGESVEGLAAGGVGEVVSASKLEGPFPYRLEEENVLVLDRARWRLGDEEWQPADEILHVDRALRRRLGVPERGGEMVQPWYRRKHLPPAQPLGQLALAFDFAVETLPSEPVTLVLESPASFGVRVNGLEVATDADEGWWIDIAFRRVTLPAGALREGANEVVLTCEFTEAIDLEALYLLGGFGVRIEGTERIATTLPATLAIGDLAAQGLPFYTGPLTYRLSLPEGAAASGALTLEVPRFKGACLVVRGNGGERVIPWRPYEARVSDLVEPDGALDLTLILTRRNLFGPLHQLPLETAGYGPGNFISDPPHWADEYVLYPAGLLQAPVLRVTER